MSSETPRHDNHRESIERQWASMILETGDVAVYAIDRDLRFTFAAGSALATIGLTEADLKGRTLAELAGIASPDDWMLAAHREVLAGATREFEYLFRNVVFEIRVRPFRSETGEIVGAIGFATDVTRRARTIEQTRQDREILSANIKARTAELERANELLQGERRLLRRMLELQERDRQFVSYEIHDGICQEMTAALMFFESISDAIKPSDELTCTNYQNGVRLVREAISESRRLIEGLRPPTFDGVKLADALAQQAKEMQAWSGIEIQFQSDELPSLAPTIELAAFRIVQESLANVWRHSGSDEAWVDVAYRHGWLRIRIRDSGKGFDPARVVKKRFGLTGVRERARLLGGEMRIISSPGQGATIDVTLPIKDVLMPIGDSPDAEDGELSPET